MQDFTRFRQLWNKRISHSTAAAKKKQGYKIGLLHMHSLYSRDVPNLTKNKPEKLLSAGHSKGADYIAITDHDNDNAWRNATSHSKNEIRGMELEVFDKRLEYPIHLGILNIQDDETSDELIHIAHQQHDAFKLVEFAREKNATVIANHPWWAPRGHRIRASQLWQFIEAFQLPVELNAKRSYIENIATIWYAAQRNLPIVSATDTHVADVFSSYTVAKGHSVKSYLENIRKGNTLVVAPSGGLFHQPKMIATYGKDIVSAQTHCKEIMEEMQLCAGSSIDTIAAWLSRDRFKKKPIRRKAAQAILYSLGIVAGLLYAPTAHAISAYKVIYDQVTSESVLEDVDLIPEPVDISANDMNSSNF